MELISSWVYKLSAPQPAAAGWDAVTTAWTGPVGAPVYRGGKETAARTRLVSFSLESHPVCAFSPSNMTKTPCVQASSHRSAGAATLRPSVCHGSAVCVNPGSRATGLSAARHHVSLLQKRAEPEASGCSSTEISELLKL